MAVTNPDEDPGWEFLSTRTLYGFGRNAPTPTHLRADQERLRLAGCTLSLVRALRDLPHERRDERPC